MCKKKKIKRRWDANIMFFLSISRGWDKFLSGILNNEHDLKFGHNLHLNDQTLLGERKIDERYKTFWAHNLNCQSVVLGCQIKAFVILRNSHFFLTSIECGVVSNTFGLNRAKKKFFTVFGIPNRKECFGSFVSSLWPFNKMLRGKNIMSNIILSIFFMLYKIPFFNENMN